MCFCIRPWGCFRYACLMRTLCMLLHLSALIALMRGLSMSSPRCPCPVFCMCLSVEACLSPSLPFAVFALRLVGCDNVCCSSLVLSITAGSGRFPAVNSQRIYVPLSLVNSKKKKKRGAPTGSHVSSMSGKRIAACAACCTRRCWVTAAARFSTRWRTCWRGGEGSNQEA